MPRRGSTDSPTTLKIYETRNPKSERASAGRPEA
jgi:hypothetical protein